MRADRLHTALCDDPAAIDHDHAIGRERRLLDQRALGHQRLGVNLGPLSDKIAGQLALAVAVGAMRAQTSIGPRPGQGARIVVLDEDDAGRRCGRR